MSLSLCIWPHRLTRVSVCVNLVIIFVGEAAREEAGELLLLLPLVSDSESVSFSSAWITNLGVGGSGDGRGALTGDLSRGVFRGGVSSSKWSLGGEGSSPVFVAHPDVWRCLALYSPYLDLHNITSALPLVWYEKKFQKCYGYFVNGG